MLNRHSKYVSVLGCVRTKNSLEPLASQGACVMFTRVSKVEPVLGLYAPISMMLERLLLPAIHIMLRAAVKRVSTSSRLFVRTSGLGVHNQELESAAEGCILLCEARYEVCRLHQRLCVWVALLPA